MARVQRSVAEQISVEPVVGPIPEAPRAGRAARPRLVRANVVLPDGHRVGVSVAGRGVPLVVVHGYSAEGFLYAQTLSRLVDLGFQVIAVDTAGHGGTQGLPAQGGDLSEYVGVLARAIDALGVRHAVLAGHSMGGRMVADLAALRPERTIGVLLLDAIVGDTWDRMTTGMRLAPLVFVPYAAALILDSVSPLHFLRDPGQAAKVARLAGPTVFGHFRHPGRLVGPAVSILRSAKSVPSLDRLKDAGVPVWVVQGTLDLVVPMATAKDAAKRTGGQFVAVHRGGHSWLLKDPEALPAIVAELLAGRLGRARDRLLRAHGVDPMAATDREVETVCYEPGALVLDLAPGGAADPGDGLRDDTIISQHKPSYRFSLRFG